MSVREYLAGWRQHFQWVDDRVSAMGFVSFVLVFSVLTEFWKVILGCIVSVFPSAIIESGRNFPDFTNNVIIIIIAVFIGPIIETLIFQKIILSISKVFFERKFISILISGLCFGISHYYNIIYVIDMTFIGFLWAYGYENRRSLIKSPFLSICCVHVITNALSIIAALIIKN